MLELHIIFKGKVQGVGFRWTLVEHAEKYQIKGTAQNLKNGTVEVFAQGTAENLEAFLLAVQDQPGFAKIDTTTKNFMPISEQYPDFSIRHQ